MSTEWLKRKKENFPQGSMEKFLKFDGSTNIIDALKKRIVKNDSQHNRPTAVTLERLSDEDQAIWLAGQIIKAMDKFNKQKRRQNETNYSGNRS